MKIKSLFIGLSLVLSGMQPSFAEPASNTPAENVTNQPTQQVKTDIVSLNSATAEELAKKLSGIGLKKAQGIVEYREKYGEFTQINQIMEVSGIGQAIFERNRDKLTL